MTNKKLKFLVIVFLLLQVNVSQAKDSLQEMTVDQNRQVEVIPFKKDSEAVVKATIGSFAYVVIFFLIAMYIFYAFRKKGFTLAQMVKVSNKINVLTINKISKNTTVLRVNIDDDEYIVFESSNNIVVQNLPSNKQT